MSSFIQHENNAIIDSLIYQNFSAVVAYGGKNDTRMKFNYDFFLFVYTFGIACYLPSHMFVKPHALSGCYYTKTHFFCAFS